MRLFFQDGLSGNMPERAASTLRPHVEKGRKFAVLDGGHEAKSILELLCALGLDIVAHHDSRFQQSFRQRYGLSKSGIKQAIIALGGASSRVKEIPSVSKREFARLINSGGVELIVASYRVDADGDQFLAACDYAVRELGFSRRCLHLSALCDIFQFPARRHLLTGIASSGNMIFQNLLEGILAYDSSEPLLQTHAAGRLVASFALQHLESIRRLFSRTIGDVAVTEVLASGTHERYGQCLVQKEDQYCSLSGLPLRSFAWGSKWTSSHEPMMGPTVDFYKEQGYDIIYILRHPLDVIVSNAGKISSVLSGDRRPRLELDNQQWFTDIVQTVCKHYEALSAHRRELKFVRYEQLMADPVEEIGRLASYVAVDLDAGARRSLWERLDGAPVAGKGHFWDPRAGKWKEHLGPVHRDIVLQSSLPELAQGFGYEIDPAGFARIADKQAPDEKLDEADLARLAWIDAILEIPIGKPASLAGDLVRIENKELGLVGFFDGQHERQGRALMSSPSLDRLVRSAFWYDRQSVPNTVREYLRL